MFVMNEKNRKSQQRTIKYKKVDITEVTLKKTVKKLKRKIQSGLISGTWT